MRDSPPPFRFDLRSLIGDARRKLNTRVGAVSISLPFISFKVEPEDLERKVATEILIRLADRRVLNAFECCDGCIENALASLQDIRSVLVNKQVELARASDGPLFLVLSAMLESIRQFLTFQERLSQTPPGLLDHHGRPARYEPKEAYFAGLEMLRAHLHRCLLQVAKIAGADIPTIPAHMRYSEPWQLEAYEAVEKEP